MLSATSQSRPNPPTTAVWPWVVMPAVVLAVFYILHYDVRDIGKSPVTGASGASSGSSIPTE